MTNAIAYLRNENAQIIPASVTALPGVLPAMRGTDWQYVATPSDWTPGRKHRTVHAAHRGEMLQLQYLIEDSIRSSITPPAALIGRLFNARA